MNTKFISFTIALLLGTFVWADSDFKIYQDCSKNGYVAGINTAPEDVQAVDLGLPSGLKWASCNVGAKKPENAGNYYAWGEVFPYKNQDTYKYSNGYFQNYTKYRNDATYGLNGFIDTLTILEKEDDAAYINWGGTWRMPTYEEWRELLSNCTYQWTKKGFK